MSRSVSPQRSLDPYLILADASLIELTFNDNIGVSGNARITQFALPPMRIFYPCHSSRPESRRYAGNLSLDITVGEITLQQGAFTVTLRWEGEADLNLFVRLPDGQIVSWSNPTVANGAQLQIDSNTGCTNPTAQPLSILGGLERSCCQGLYGVGLVSECVRVAPACALLA